MQQPATVYRKYVNQMTIILSTPPLLEMWEIALPTPLRIDAPEHDEGLASLASHHPR